LSAPGSRLQHYLAGRLLAHAQSVMPPGRAAWAHAMRNELGQFKSGREALRWAAGCVVAGYYERFRVMKIGTSTVSRAILVLEMLLCFAPLTWLCVFVVANLHRMQGDGLLGEGLLDLSLAALGPIGLIVAFRTIFLDRPSLNRFAALALCVIATWTLLAYSLHVLAAAGGSAGDWWREFVLIALLPAVGIAHLSYLGLHQSGNCRNTS